MQTILLDLTNIDIAMIIIWSVFIVAAVIIELMTGDLLTIWFVIGAIGALIATVFGLEIYYQISIFLVISAAALFITRPIAKRLQQKEVIRTNADRVIGMIGVVTIAFKAGEIGQIKVNNENWRAICSSANDFDEGDKVQVEAISGTKVIVSKIEKDNIVKL